MSKLLVAFRPEVLEALDDWLAAPYSVPPLIDEALMVVRQAKALYANEAPVRLMPRKEIE